jgi:hypothetical protein
MSAADLQAECYRQGDAAGVVRPPEQIPLVLLEGSQSEPQQSQDMFPYQSNVMPVEVMEQFFEHFQRERRSLLERVQDLEQRVDALEQKYPQASQEDASSAHCEHPWAPQSQVISAYPQASQAQASSARPADWNWKTAEILHRAPVILAITEESEVCYHEWMPNKQWRMRCHCSETGCTKWFLSMPGTGSEPYDEIKERGWGKTQGNWRRPVCSTCLSKMGRFPG